MDEVDIKADGRWCDPYHAVDKAGHTIDFPYHAAGSGGGLVFKAIRRHGVPETITIEGSEANAAATKSSNAAYGTATAIRQARCLDDLPEQDHLAVKRGGPSHARLPNS